jgi:hypothetical protein
MQDLFAALLQSPTAQRYKRLRSEWLAAQALPEFALRLAELESLLSAECMTVSQLAAAQQLTRELQATGKLSLKWHRLAGALALQSGDTLRAELHKFAYEALVQALLATGKGTQKSPYFTIFTSDAPELAYATGHSVKSQSYIEHKERRFDVLLCENEREFWFDVTDLLPTTVMAVVRKRRPKEGTVASSRRKMSGRNKSVTGSR